MYVYAGRCQGAKRNQPLAFYAHALLLHEKLTRSSLDHPLEEMNTIEMQSVTALAHLRAAVLFFIDIRYVCLFSHIVLRWKSDNNVASNAAIP